MWAPHGALFLLGMALLTLAVKKFQDGGGEKNKCAAEKTTEIRREEILRAALLIVEQQGLDNLNTNAIAALIQLVPSAIYRHLKNKEEIIAALIDFIGERLQQNLQQATTQEGTALKRLKVSLNSREIAARRAVDSTYSLFLN